MDSLIICLTAQIRQGYYSAVFKRCSRVFTVEMVTYTTSLLKWLRMLANRLYRAFPSDAP